MMWQYNQICTVILENPSMLQRSAIFWRYLRLDRAPKRSQGTCGAAFAFTFGPLVSWVPPPPNRLANPCACCLETWIGLTANLLLATHLDRRPSSIQGALGLKLRGKSLWLCPWSPCKTGRWRNCKKLFIWKEEGNASCISITQGFIVRLMECRVYRILKPHISAWFLLDFLVGELAMPEVGGAW